MQLSLGKGQRAVKGSAYEGMNVYELQPIPFLVRGIKGCTTWKLFKRCRIRLPKVIGQRVEGLFPANAEATQFIGPDVKGEESKKGSSMVLLSPAGRGNLAEGEIGRAHV